MIGAIWQAFGLIVFVDKDLKNNRKITNTLIKLLVPNALNAINTNTTMHDFCRRGLMIVKHF